MKDSPQTVIVVDDDDAVRNSLRLLLKSAGIHGFTPVKALGSGATANVCLCERGPEKWTSRAT